VEQAVRTRPFLLLWCVLLLNVTAGLGVLGQAAAMIEEVFDGVSAGAIHGRVLTALSAAGLFGPTLVNYLREHWIAQGYSKARAYDATLYIMAGLLVVGFLCNRAIRSLAAPPPERAPTAELLSESG